MTTFRLPDSLANSSDDAALGLLERYFGPQFGASEFYTGAAFDTWDSTGTRASDTNRFTADDLVAVTFLSVHVGPEAAATAARFDCQVRWSTAGPSSGRKDVPSRRRAWLTKSHVGIAERRHQFRVLPTTLARQSCAPNDPRSTRRVPDGRGSQQPAASSRCTTRWRRCPL